MMVLTLLSLIQATITVLVDILTTKSRNRVTLLHLVILLMQTAYSIKSMIL